MNKTTKFLINVSLGVQISCINSEENSNTASTDKIKIESQGVNIDYDDIKNGDTTLLFIHGWNIDKTYWANQIAFFSFTCIVTIYFTITT